MSLRGYTRLGSPPTWSDDWRSGRPGRPPCTKRQRSGGQYILKELILLLLEQTRIGSRDGSTAANPIRVELVEVQCRFVPNGSKNPSDPGI